MPAPDIGKIDCACCKRAAPVRRSASGSLYWVCKNCGIFHCGYKGGQQYIREHAELFEDAPAPANDPPAAPPAESKPAPVSAKTAAPAGGLASWLDPGEL